MIGSDSSFTFIHDSYIQSKTTIEQYFHENGIVSQFLTNEEVIPYFVAANVCKELQYTPKMIIELKNKVEELEKFKEYALVRYPQLKDQPIGQISTSNLTGVSASTQEDSKTVAENSQTVDLNC